MPEIKKHGRPQPADFGLSNDIGNFKSGAIFYDGNALVKFIVFCAIVILEIVAFSSDAAQRALDKDFTLCMVAFIFAGLASFPMVFRLWPLLGRVEFLLRCNLDRTFGSQIKFHAALAAYDQEVLQRDPNHCPRCGSRDIAIQAVQDQTGTISSTASPMVRWILRISGMHGAVDRTEWFCHDCGWSAPHTPL